MPIYEYQCQACGKRLEELQKFSDPALIDCPSCGQPTLKRLMSNTSFQLKGGGYYATDYKSSPPKKEETANAQKAEKTDTAAKTSGQADKQTDKKE